MSKQTAVEWLVEEINKQKAWADPSKLEPIIEQAKQMNKEQIVDSFENYLSYHDERGEVYYNETYGGSE